MITITPNRQRTFFCKLTCLLTVVVLPLQSVVCRVESNFAYSDLPSRVDNSYYTKSDNTVSSSTHHSTFSSKEHGLQNQTKEGSHPVTLYEKPGQTKYHWYLYEYDEGKDLKHGDGGGQQYGYPQYTPPSDVYANNVPQSYDDYYNHNYYHTNEVYKQHSLKNSKWKELLVKALILKKLFHIIGPAIFCLPLFLTLVPLVLPTIPLAFLLGKIQGATMQLPQLPGNLITPAPIQIPITFPTSSTSSSTSSLSPPGMTSMTPSQPMMSSQQSSFSSTSSSFESITDSPTMSMQMMPMSTSSQSPEMPSSASSPETMQNQTMMGAGRSPVEIKVSKNPPSTKVLLDGILPQIRPPFPFLYLNNTFDDMHYRKKHN